MVLVRPNFVDFRPRVEGSRLPQINMADLQLSVADEADCRTICVTGEVDLSTCEQLRGVLDQASGADLSATIVDLTGVSFMDSTGLGVLIAASAAAKDSSRRLEVITKGGIVGRFFELTQVAEYLNARDLSDDDPQSE